MLLEHDKPFNFDENCLKTFVEWKRAHVTALVVVVPHWSMLFELMCDTSDHSIGAVLGQRNGKIFHLIYYASKTLADTQLNYITTEK